MNETDQIPKRRANRQWWAVLALLIVGLATFFAVFWMKIVSSPPPITRAQIEKDLRAALPEAEGVYEPGPIEILETQYGGDRVLIKVRAGTVRVFAGLSPVRIENLDVQPQVASFEERPWRVNLMYKWDRWRSEWRLNLVDQVTYDLSAKQ